MTLSLYQNAVWSLGWELQAVLSAGVEDGWRYQKRASNPLSNKYLTKDGRWIEIACLQSDRHWPDFCKSIEREDLTGDSRFNTRLARQENCEALIKVIDEAFSKRTADEWEGVLTRNGIVFEKARSFKEIAADPQATQNGFFAEVEHPSGKRMKLVNSPAKFNGVSSPIRMTAPELGQDDEEVLLELGYTWEQISDLKEQKIIL